MINIYSKLASLALLFLAALIAFLVWAELPKIVRAVGYTATVDTAWKATAPVAALLLNLPVQAGTAVQRGQVVAELSFERFAQNRNLEESQVQLSREKLAANAREQSLARFSAQVQKMNLHEQIGSLSQELSHYGKEMLWRNERLADLKEQTQRYEVAQVDGSIAREDFENKRGQTLAFQGERSLMLRQQLALERERKRLAQERSLLDVRADTQIAQLRREKAVIEQEMNEAAAKRLQLVTPIDGVVTQLNVAQGQMLRPELPLMTVLPQGSDMEVLLLLPSRSIGFVRAGQRVSVRYQAFAHEHYGRHWGKVREISRAALPPQELPQHIRMDEPVYTVRVALPANFLEYEGKRLPITAGMMIEADVELDRLKIYQWLLEPLYRLGGRV